jgi:hypothetical protein
MLRLAAELDTRRGERTMPAAGRSSDGHPLAGLSGMVDDQPRTFHDLSVARCAHDFDVPLRPVHADALPVLDQLGGVLHPHDGR